jgi:uncharacterized membrane protein
MNKTLKTFIIIGLSFLIFDYIFIYLLQKDSWDNQISLIQNGALPMYRPFFGVVVYLIMIFCVYFLIISPATEYNYSLSKVASNAALLGLAFYGVFDGTNYVMFKDYKMSMALKDTIYGVFVTTITSLLAINNF